MASDSSNNIFSQWEDLRNHCDSTLKSLQTILESLGEREAAVSRRETQFELGMSSKKDELERIEKSIEEASQELPSKRRRFYRLTPLLLQSRRELEAKFNTYCDVLRGQIWDKFEEISRLEDKVRLQEKKNEANKTSFSNVQKYVEIREGQHVSPENCIDKALSSDTVMLVCNMDQDMRSQRREKRGSDEGEPQQRRNKLHRST